MKKLALAACLNVALLAATPLAQAKVLDSSAAGFTVENSVIVPVDPKTAWAAFVDHVDAWWPKDHSWFGKAGKFTIEPRAGGCFCETAGDKQALHMLVTFVDPAVLMRMSGGLGPLAGMGLTGTLDWKFEQVKEGTKITMHYVAGGYTTTDLKKFVAIVDQVNAIQLGGLGSMLNKKQP